MKNKREREQRDVTRTNLNQSTCSSVCVCVCDYTRHNILMNCYLIKLICTKKNTTTSTNITNNV